MTDTISKHFKKIENKEKSQSFQIRNIDFIYLINLDKRPERWQRCRAQLVPYYILPHRVSGINGWALGQDTFDDVAMRVESGMQYDQPVQVSFQPGNYPATPFSKVEIGKCCLHSQAPGGGMGGCLTHLSILEDALRSGCETIWVLEDDFTVNGDPHQLAFLIDRLDALTNRSWDVLYTDDDDYYTRQNVKANCGSYQWLRPGMPMSERLIERTAVGGDFFKIGGRTQAHSYIVRKSGLEKIMHFVKTRGLFFPFDTELPCVENLSLYNLKYDLVHGRDRKYSDTYYRNEA